MNVDWTIEERAAVSLLTHALQYLYKSTVTDWAPVAIIADQRRSICLAAAERTAREYEAREKA